MLMFQPLQNVIPQCILLLGLFMVGHCFAASKSAESVIVETESRMADITHSPLTSPAVRTAFNAQVAQLHATEQLTGQFEQHKYIAVLSKPISSQGNFSYQRRGNDEQPKPFFMWQMTAPIKVAYFADGEHFYLEQNGQQRDIEPRKDPVLFGFLSVFVKVLGADFSEVEKQFEIFFEPASNAAPSWQILLKPKNPLMTKTIEHLRLSGSAQVEQLIIREPNGDHTDIRFSHETPVSDICVKSSSESTPAP